MGGVISSIGVSSWRSIFFRVLAVVLASGLVALGLAAFAAVNVVGDHLEAQLVESATQRAREVSTKLDHTLELSKAEASAVSLAADAGRPLEIPELVSPSTLAILCKRGEEVLFEAFSTAQAEAIMGDITTPGAEVVVIRETSLLTIVQTGDVHTLLLVDVSHHLTAAPGWSITMSSGQEAQRDHEAPAVRAQIAAGGVLARREETGSGEEFVRAMTSSSQGVSVEVRAPLAPARTASFAVMQRIVIWSSVVILPLLIMAWLLSRAVTSPVRSLASAVRRARGEVVQLPLLPRDEIGDLGGAIHAMSERLSEDAQALRTAVDFARRVNLMREEAEVIGALEVALTSGIPSSGWNAFARPQIEDTDETELAGVPVGLLQLFMGTDFDRVEIDKEAHNGEHQRVPMASSQSIPVIQSVGIEGLGEILHIVLRHGDSVYGVVIGRSVHEASVGHAELLCRAASAALRNLDLFRSVLANEKLVVLGRVVAGVAHEVNNPLAFVLANLRALEEELSGTQREAVIETREGAERMGRIIGDLSTLSRGGMQVSLVESDLAEVAQEAVRVAQARCPDGQIRIDAPKPVKIGGDPDRLIQVLANLIINGLEAASVRDVPKVEVRVTVDEETALVDVKDNAKGISKSVLSRLFDAFFTTKGDKGTGLGLFISRSLAHAHGGDLWVQETGRQGTVFRLELPINVLRRDTYTPIPRAPRISTIPPDDTSRPSILVIDDEVALVRALKRWLGRWAVVTGTDDPFQGLDLAESGSFDLVLCDIDMPRMRGQEFIAELRERNPDAVGHVVLMTGSSSGEVKGVKVLRKPLDEEILKKLVYDEVVRS